MVTVLTQGISIGINLASTVILARLLSPEDYGTIAMVVAITSFAGLFRELGLSSAAIQKKNLTHAQQSNLFWLNVTMGALLTAIVAAASPLVAWFYGKPDLTLVTLALSASFLIGSLSTQHGARMVREMRFASQAVATIAGTLVTLSIAVTLALHGWSYWALVWGNLAGALTTTLLLIILSPFRPAWFRMGAGIREMLGFGANVTAFDLVNYFHRNLDNLLIGKFWGTESLGLYSRAYTLMMLPINAIRGPLNAVAFPAMSRLQHDPNSYRAYYCRVTSLLALSSMPLVAFLFVAARPLIEVTLGPQWLGVSTIFAILGVTAFIQPVGSLRGLVLLSSGQGRRYFYWGGVNATSVCVGYAIGVAWGATGVAISYAIVNYFILYPSLLLAFKNTPLKPSDFFSSLALPASVSIIAAAITLFASNAVEHAANAAPWLMLVIRGGLFLTSFMTMLWSLPAGRRELRRFVSLSKEFRSAAS